jgi:DNA polymerase III subunit epsilon
MQLDDCLALIDRHPDYRVLRRLVPRDVYDEPDGSTRRAIFLDVETTGLEPGREPIIELAMVEFDYDRRDHLIRIGRTFESFEDPRRPIPPEITALTGITGAMVAGQRIDDAAVAAFVAGAGVIVAHNATFDRAHLEARLPIFRDLPWACSVRDVAWREHGYQLGASLEAIAYRNGLFFDGHRAAGDCRAALHLLGTAQLGDGRPALAHLLTTARTPAIRLEATRAPFEAKDDLKTRGYRWNGERRVWYLDLPEAKLAEERAWLFAHVYRGEAPLHTVRLDPKLRYSPRLG